MPIKLNFAVKNWKLAGLTLIFIVVFTSLGVWQLSRAQEKRLLQTMFTNRTSYQPFSAQDLVKIKDWRFYRVHLTGTFDNAHTFLLDNKTFHGQVGYEVYTPFYAKGLKTPLLVDRGFISINNRTTLPFIRDISGTTKLTGMLNLPPLYVTLGQIKDASNLTWPLRVEFINLATMGSILNTQFFPYVLIMDPKDPRAFLSQWEVTIVAPERHMAYAIQWFALALTLLILFVALNRTR